MFKKLGLTIAIISLIQGCSTQTNKPVNSDIPVGVLAEPEVVEVPELTELLNENIKSIDHEIGMLNGGGAEALRLKSIQEVGFESGVYRGRRWRQEKINSWLKDMNNMLATTFNFDQVIIDGVFLPPRVEEIKGHVEKRDDGSLRIIRQGYRIASEAELVVSPPTYLNYLYQKVDPPKPLNRLGLPEAKTNEVHVFREAVVEGWKLGVKQADLQFNQDLNLLKRDYGGMLLYIDLVTKGLISPPKVNNQSFGVMISGDGKTLNVGDEILTIGRTPSFQHHEKWETLPEGVSQGESHE